MNTPMPSLTPVEPCCGPSVEFFDDRRPSMLELAISYAADGFPVFPCCPATKKPFSPHGFHDATTDEAMIRRWWKNNPDAMIGWPTKGFLVLDVDQPQGPNSLQALEVEHGPLPKTMTTRTPSGGTHYILKSTEAVKNSTSGIGVDLDIRGDGGYIILAGSVNVEGKAYEAIVDLPPAEAPKSLVQMANSCKSGYAKRPKKETVKPDIQKTTYTVKKRYALAALEQEAKKVRTAPEGTRNATLNESAFSIGTLVAGGELTKSDAVNVLTPAAEAAGLSPTEIERTIRSGIEGGAQYPRQAPSDTGKHSTLQKPALGGEEKTYRLTELGNAERFRDQYEDSVRYVSAWGKWIFYDGRRWQVGADDKIRIMAHATVKNLYIEAAQNSDNDMAQKIARWAAQSCKSNSISAMLKEASALLSIDSSVLDANPWLFNCQNCTIDLKTGNFRPHQRHDWITKISPVIFDPEAKAPTFEKVLQVCFSGKRELIDFVQRFAGYCLSGSTKEQCLIIWWGGGANGKSTILNAIAEALGDYAQTTRPETLMVKHRDGIPSDLAKLKGARLVTAAEAEDGHRLAESQIKQMTGGEKIQARALYQDWFEYTPEFKIVLCTNHKPVIRGEDFAIWRRIRLVPFTVTIPEQDRDKDLPDKLRTELPGILTWIITGAAEWLTSGLGNPTEVQEATADYKSEQSVINNFLESCCVVQIDAQVEGGQLFQAFDRWRTNEGQRKITQTKFGKMLSPLGFEKTRSTAGRTIYRGIGLTNPSDYSELFGEKRL